MKLGLVRSGRASFVFLVRGCFKTAAYPSIGACVAHHSATSPHEDTRMLRQMCLDSDRVQASARPALTTVRCDENGSSGGAGGRRRGSEHKNVTAAFPSLDFFAGTPPSLSANTRSRLIHTSGANRKSGAPEPQHCLHSRVGRRPLSHEHDGLVRTLMYSAWKPHHSYSTNHEIRQSKNVCMAHVESVALVHAHVESVALVMCRSQVLSSCALTSLVIFCAHDAYAGTPT